MMPAISVVIPAHNEENYIDKTLQSLKQQSFQDFEVIVVSNGCVDKTEEIVRKKENRKIKCLSLSKANVSRARNHGASKAEGPILLFLDADTTLEPDALQKINEQFSPRYSVATTLSAPDVSKLKYHLRSYLKNFYLSTSIYKGCSGALICRREDFEKVNAYDSELKIMEQRNLINKLLKLGKYKCINTKAVTSMRRFERWGLTKSLWFWIRQGVKNKLDNVYDSEYEEVR